MDRQTMMLRVFGAAEWRECFTRYKDADKKVRGWLYKTYLDSDAWNRQKAKRKAIDGEKCQGALCFRTDSLEIHHKTYDRIGDEDVANDLITLCERCHSKEHKRGGEWLFPMGLEQQEARS